MFYYLLYNSSFLEKNANDKHIKLLIYGTIMYIVMHGLIFSLSQLSKFQNYYWLLFALDIGSIYIVLKNGSNGILNINTTFYSDEKKESERDKEDTLSDIDQQRLAVNVMNDKLSSLKIKTEQVTNNNNKEKKVRFTEETPKQTNDLENIKMEIKDTLLSNNKQKKTEMERINRMKKNSATESDTDFGSDIDFDAFEKSLD